MRLRRIALPARRLAPGHLETAAFLAILVGAGWPLMFASRLLGMPDLALWVPGAAALLIVRSSGRGALRRLGIDRVGWPDAYLVALWLPVLLAAGQIALVVALRAGRLDADVGGLHPASGAPPTIDAVGRLVGAILLVPFGRTLLTVGSEIGWRAYLLPRLLPLGSWRAITLTSALWWAWQLPLVLDMRSGRWPLEATFFLFWSLFVGEVLGWLYLRTRSVWAPALFSAAIGSVSYLPAAVLRDVSPDAAFPFGPAALILPAIVVLFIRMRSDGDVLPVATSA